MESCKEPQTCMVCEKKRSDVLLILNKPICTICEQDMVGVRTTDSVYDFYVARLKEIW
jgi:hypothetical protein